MYICIIKIYCAIVYIIYSDIIIIKNWYKHGLLDYELTLSEVPF